jgi:plasmid stabilization system protein ParE
MKEPVWTQKFDTDLQEIYQRLETWQEDAGDAFYIDVLETIETLCVHPFIGALVRGEHMRRILVHRRKFGIFYTVESRGLILHRLLDLRQDPDRIEYSLRQI